MQPTPVFLPGESQGQRSLVGYSPQDCKESNTTGQLTLSFHYEKKKLNVKLWEELADGSIHGF